MDALGMYGEPVPPPHRAILLRAKWNYRVKSSGKRRSRQCCDGSLRAAPYLHSLGNTFASCMEHPVFRLFIALSAGLNLKVFGGDAKDAFAHSPGPSTATFLRIDDAFAEWYEAKMGKPIDRSLVLPIQRALQGHPEAARLWEEHINGISSELGFKSTTHDKTIYTAQIDGKLVLLA